MPNVFTPDECNQIIAMGKNKQQAKMDSEFRTDNNYRDSKIEFIHPTDESSWVYAKSSSAIMNLNARFFNFDLFGFDEPLQLTEYNAPSGKYKKHLDSCIGICIRKLSIVVQLSDPNEYEGGDLQIHINDSPIPLNREQGMMLAFPSYILHEVTPITKGTRHSLVGWTSGEPFK
jgi:PKHD-type hydroxylase